MNQLAQNMIAYARGDSVALMELGKAYLDVAQDITAECAVHIEMCARSELADAQRRRKRMLELGQECFRLAREVVGRR